MATQNIILSHRGCQTNVSQNSRNKKSVKSNKGLLPTPNKRALNGKEVIHVVEYDDKIRELVVPSQEPTVYPVLLDTDEFNRLKQQAKVNMKTND
jgi:hypothetical protein